MRLASMGDSKMDTFKRLKEVLATAETDDQGRMRLPPERKLAEQLGVQRSMVREQLATLENLGFIRRTRGSGTFLQMPQPAFVQIYFDIALRLGYISVDALEGAREMLEREIAYSAASKATEADIVKLEGLLAVMNDNSNVNESLAADYDFHRHLAYMTQNPVIILIIQGLASVLKEVVHRRRVLVRQSQSSMEKTNGSHVAVIEALRKRDPEAAKQAMDTHFRVWDQESKERINWFTSAE
ncbi:hypothetical protein C7H85_11135 [Zobellella endophytica]|uniref:HTH gntR-type domain-containing protein n=2 Tax=Zobellella endophytica TaxID=2116700 RepID=A0A2P7R4R0_9GAMM|nr:hypothetical protein C7H85_11135 [Zobellella endophytica]